MGSKHFISLLEMATHTPEELETLMKNNLNIHETVNKTIRKLTRVTTITEYIVLLNECLDEHNSIKL